MSLASIYKITNMVNKKPYIGFTARNIETRWKEHQAKAKDPSSYFKLHNAINKYGVDNFKIATVYEHPDHDHVLNTMEPFFIQWYDAIDNGYNLTFGGEGGTMSDETKAKISQSKLGHEVTPETRKKLSKYVSEIQFPWNWKVITPDGIEHIYSNLNEFERDHGISAKGLRKVSRDKYPNRSYKGHIVFKIDKNSEEDI